ncbi:mandelate racemase/muconate lactonizing enzyme family protein [Paraburkholderia sp. Ac-20336]|uniref:mandelate racemase/muconate lactonizing enzyme family protein n=1 Tax=Paraburkholderia sp. Ac-20336 TaxID=2703886 RepID=UPI001980F6A1|nr:mandelate racemase/muconate lactonizing enzyme family protein [Paraburkholderia sp. Ac-20336]MBN3801918.1 mandelate racemase/muconate lactonizing enzyme family protein [Paraburkholderia sp. Ac-20336]
MAIAEVEAFQMVWDGPNERPTAFVKITTDDGIVGYGECTPMHGGIHVLTIIANMLAKPLIGRNPLDHAVIADELLHKYMKLGPDGSLTAALAAIDIALWDIKGKMFNQPIYQLLGGAWRTELPFYTSLGQNAHRTVDETLREVEKRLKRDEPSALKIRFDPDRTTVDADIANDIAKAKAVRKLVGDSFPLGFDGNNGYSVAGAIRVGRALEELNFAWFEEPVQHYYVEAMGEVARRLDILVTAGEQTYTLQGAADLIKAGVKVIQCDPIKMGGITGVMRCMALAYAHGAEVVPHQTQPTVGHAANLQMMACKMHASKPVEWNDPVERNTELMETLLKTPWTRKNGKFSLPTGPGLGIELDEEVIRQRKRSVASVS